MFNPPSLLELGKLAQQLLTILAGSLGRRFGGSLVLLLLLLLPLLLGLGLLLLL